MNPHLFKFCASLAFLPILFFSRGYAGPTICADLFAKSTEEITKTAPKTWDDLVKNHAAGLGRVISRELFEATLSEMKIDVARANQVFARWRSEHDLTRFAKEFAELQDFINQTANELARLDRVELLQQRDIVVLGYDIATLNTVFMNRGRLNQLLRRLEKYGADVGEGTRPIMGTDFEYAYLAALKRVRSQSVDTMIEELLGVSGLLVLPTYESISLRELNEISTYPVVVVGLSRVSMQVDGTVMHPLYFYLHDIGHGLDLTSSFNLPPGAPIALIQSELERRRTIRAKFVAVLQDQPVEKQILLEFIWFYVVHEWGLPLREDSVREALTRYGGIPLNSVMATARHPEYLLYFNNRPPEPDDIRWAVSVLQPLTRYRVR